MRKSVLVAAVSMILCGASVRAVEFEVPVAPAEATSALPAPGGPYPVGVRAFSWIDQSRPELATGEENDFREVTVQIWFPAEAATDAPNALYAPEMEKILAAAVDLPPREQSFINAHAVLLGIATNSKPGARIAHSESPWPVVLFSPGGNVSRHFQTSLAERLASRGLVFVSMTHPYSTLDVALHSGFSKSIDWGLDDEDDETALANDNRLADVLAGDARFVADRLAELAAGDDPFFDSLATSRLGIAGHSRGGTTVGRACASDDRFAACAVLDNIGPEREQKTGVPPPFLTLRSPWDDERVALLHDYLGRTGSVAHDVVLTGSNHFTCTDLPLFIADLRLEGIDPVAGIDACAATLTGFFDTFLRDRPTTSAPWRPRLDHGAFTMRRFKSQGAAAEEPAD